MSNLLRVQQVGEQTTRRLFKVEPVPAAEKLVSIFEPHTVIIWQGKPNQATKFGHKVWLGVVESGLISSYRTLTGNSADQQQWQPTLKQHQRLFGQPSNQASADQGVYSVTNEQIAQELGVKLFGPVWLPCGSRPSPPPGAGVITVTGVVVLATVIAAIIVITTITSVGMTTATPRTDQVATSVAV